MNVYSGLREQTKNVLNALDEGLLNPDALCRDLLSWMSESDVNDFVHSNKIIEVVDPDYVEDYDEEEYDYG